MVDRLNKKSGAAACRRACRVFLKAQLSAQVSSAADFFATILLVKLFGLFYLYATFLGAIVGGVVNCVINYGWVFHAAGCKKKYVALKYFLVWGGSILLNTWGTFALTEWLTGMGWINSLLGYYVDNVFILPKIVVALLVGFFWNYQLQRLFVYRNYNIRDFIQRHFRDK